MVMHDIPPIFNNNNPSSSNMYTMTYDSTQDSIENLACKYMTADKDFYKSELLSIKDKSFVKSLSDSCFYDTLDLFIEANSEKNLKLLVSNRFDIDKEKIHICTMSDIANSDIECDNYYITIDTHDIFYVDYNTGKLFKVSEDRSAYNPLVFLGSSGGDGGSGCMSNINTHYVASYNFVNDVTKQSYEHIISHKKKSFDEQKKYIKSIKFDFSLGGKYPELIGKLLNYNNNFMISIAMIELDPEFRDTFIEETSSRVDLHRYMYHDLGSQGDVLCIDKNTPDKLFMINNKSYMNRVTPLNTPVEHFVKYGYLSHNMAAIGCMKFVKRHFSKIFYNGYAYDRTYSSDGRYMYIKYRTEDREYKICFDLIKNWDCIVGMECEEYSYRYAPFNIIKDLFGRGV